MYSLGVSTNRDEHVYDFRYQELTQKVQYFISKYNEEVDRYKYSRQNNEVDDFVNYNIIKWSSTLKKRLLAGKKILFTEKDLQRSLYRPFTKQFLFHNPVALDRPGFTRQFLPPINDSNLHNIMICIPSLGGRSSYWCLATSLIPNITLSSIDGNQCIPLFTFFEGSSPRENITDWALQKFRTQYLDHNITKWNIFYYVYGYLHHPGYRGKYSLNLKRDLPRIPFAPNFWAFSKAGKRLTEIHVNYEDQPEYPLTMVENPNHPLDWRVEKMKLSSDKTSIVYNKFLTLTGIPPEVYEYKLGNRSALEWIIDQYRVKTDKRSGIVNDPNNPDDPEYIVKLIKKIVTVSLETVQIVKGLPEEFE